MKSNFLYLLVRAGATVVALVVNSAQALPTIVVLPHAVELTRPVDAREARDVAAGASAQEINAKARYERMSNLRKQHFIGAAGGIEVLAGFYDG